MKLGEMLVRDGRLSQAQLQSVLAQQAREGGRVGTIMVEMGLIDLDALTVYLGLELGIPIASGAMLERAKRYIEEPRLVRDIIDAGTEKARITARETMKDVRQAMGLNY